MHGVVGHDIHGDLLDGGQQDFQQRILLHYPVRQLAVREQLHGHMHHPAADELEVMVGREHLVEEAVVLHECARESFLPTQNNFDFVNFELFENFSHFWVSMVYNS